MKFSNRSRLVAMNNRGFGVIGTRVGGGTVVHSTGPYKNGAPPDGSSRISTETGNAIITEDSNHLIL